MNFGIKTIGTKSSLQKWAVAISLCLWAASATWAASPIKQDMKAMKAAYNAAMDSTTIPAFSAHFNELKMGAHMAAVSPYSPDQMTYDKGMRELQGYFVQIDAALKANDLSKAKQELGAVNQARRHYHQLLD